MDTYHVVDTTGSKAPANVGTTTESLRFRKADGIIKEM